MRGATGNLCLYCPLCDISIHAPHAGRDVYSFWCFRLLVISIHAPHAGRDCKSLALPVSISAFQSTRPMRGATQMPDEHIPDAVFQSTRPMRGATARCKSNTHRINISIHAPHAGRDRQHIYPQGRKHHFNPRAPCGARHPGTCEKGGSLGISIHAPHAGRDPLGLYYKPDCGSFQSTRPMRGAT